MGTAAILQPRTSPCPPPFILSFPYSKSKSPEAITCKKRPKANFKEYLYLGYRWYVEWNSLSLSLSSEERVQLTWHDMTNAELRGETRINGFGTFVRRV
jgi:hypothetical protein